MGGERGLGNGPGTTKDKNLPPTVKSCRSKKPSGRGGEKVGPTKEEGGKTGLNFIMDRTTETGYIQSKCNS